MLAVFVVGSTSFALPAAAQFADPDFWSTGGDVSTLALEGDLLYAGGRFTYVGPSNGSCVALGRVSGTPLPGWPRVNGRVSAIASDGTGGWIVGGLFSRVNGVARRNLARIRPDGALDPGMPEPDGEVRAIVVTEGIAYVGGDFTHVGSEARARLAAVRLANGAVTPWNPGANSSVRALAASGARLYVGGDFATLAGEPRAHLAAFATASGALETWNPPTNGPVKVLLPAAGRLFVGGYFWQVQGVTRVVAACVDSASGQVTGWNAGLSATNADVMAMATDGERVFIGGRFTTSNGQYRNGLVAVDAETGSTLPWQPNVTVQDWNPTIQALAVVGDVLFVGGWFDGVGAARRTNLAAVDAMTGTVLGWQGGSEGEIHALATSGDEVVAGGQTRSCGGLARANLAAFDLSSGAATDWQPSTNKEVRAVLPAGGTVYLGGSFSIANGQQRYGAAAVAAGTGELLAWNPVVSGSIYSMLAHEGLVYMGGFFDSVNGVPRSYLAAVDSVSGLPAPWNPSADYTVITLARDADTLYAGGMFWHVGGEERHGLAALDATTGQATAWNPNVTGVVYALALDETNLFAGGMISSVGATPASGFARISRTTGLTDFAPLLMGTHLVTGLALDGGAVYLGGEFQTSPQIGQRVNLAAFESGPCLLLPWWFGLGGGQSLTLAARDGLVYVSGFSWAEPTICSGLVRLRPQDTVTPSVIAFPTTDTVLGDPTPITWSATDDFRVESVDAELSRHGPDGPWEALFLGAANTGSLQWTATGPPSDSCWLRIRARDYQGNLGLSEAAGPFRLAGPTTDVPASVQSSALVLGRPTPSPARASFRIAFELPASAPVRLSLLDVQGREVACVRDGPLGAGRHEATLDARDFAPGLYFVRLRAAGSERVRRLVVVGR